MKRYLFCVNPSTKSEKAIYKEGTLLAYFSEMKGLVGLLDYSDVGHTKKACSHGISRRNQEEATNCCTRPKSCSYANR